MPSHHVLVVTADAGQASRLREQLEAIGHRPTLGVDAATTDAAVADLDELAAANAELQARQRELVAAEERVRHALAASGVATWEYDPQTRDLRWSANASAVLGLPRGTSPATFDEFLEHVHPDDRGVVAEVEPQVVGNQVSLPHEWDARILGADGDVRWVSGRGQRWAQTADGRLVAVGAVIEITQRKGLEEELGRARAEAEAANQAKTDYLGRLSHEIRTPLSTVIGFAQLLELESLPAPAASAVGHIQQAGRHLLRLVDDVLDIARIEAGRVSVNLEPVAVGELVRTAADLVAAQALDRDIDISIADDSVSDLYVLADAQHLSQVLVNLAGNAVKYNVEGGRVRLQARVEGGDVRIEVTDDGPGIPAENLPRLFEPFDRLDADQGEQTGSGLGLPLSRSLTELMGGVLDVESSHGSGSTFYVRLPAPRPPD